MLQVTACPRRLAVWEVSVASFSRRMCGSETALDSQGTRGPGQIQGKSDWQVPIMPSRVPRQRTLLPASHFNSWSDRLIWLSAGILHTALTTFLFPLNLWFDEGKFSLFKKTEWERKKTPGHRREPCPRELNLFSLSDKLWNHSSTCNLN